MTIAPKRISYDADTALEGTRSPAAGPRVRTDAEGRSQATPRRPIMAPVAANAFASLRRFRRGAATRRVVRVMLTALAVPAPFDVLVTRFAGLARRFFRVATKLDFGRSGGIAGDVYQAVEGRGVDFEEVQ